MNSTDRGFRDWMTILGRTGTFDWELVGLSRELSSMLDCLRWKVSTMDEAAAAYAQAADVLLGGRPEDGVDPGPLAYAPWVQATAGAAATCERVRTLSSEDPAALSELGLRDAYLRTLAHYAGRAKDAAMDVRLCLSAFGWWLIRAIVAALRDDVAGKDRVEAERALAPFSPMLVLLGRIMEEREESRDKTATAVDELSAKVQEAAEDRDAAAARLKLRGEPKVPRDALLTLARRGVSEDETPPPPGRRGRRTRR